MSIEPILFNTEMVRAILGGRKTQMRRVIKTTDGIPLSEYSDIAARRFIYDSNAIHKSPYSIGDIMWVRETFDDVAIGHPWFYKADGDLRPECWKGENWHPSIHMPKEAARIFLRVNDVRVERLQEIDEEDAVAEGFADSPTGTESPLERFTVLWDKTVKRDDLRKYGWHANPWVWIIEFERCDKPEGWC